MIACFLSLSLLFITIQVVHCILRSEWLLGWWSSINNCNSFIFDRESTGMQWLFILFFIKFGNNSLRSCTHDPIILDREVFRLSCPWRHWNGRNLQLSPSLTIKQSHACFVRVARLWHHANFFLFDNLCSHKFLVSVSVVSIDVVLYSIKLLGVSLQVCLLDRWRRILKHLIELVVVVVELLLLDLLDLVRVIRQTIKSPLYLDALSQKLIFPLINIIRKSCHTLTISSIFPSKFSLLKSITIYLYIAI